MICNCNQERHEFFNISYIIQIATVQIDYRQTDHKTCKVAVLLRTNTYVQRICDFDEEGHETFNNVNIIYITLYRFITYKPTNNLHY